jgi:hypothetical protein
MVANGDQDDEDRRVAVQLAENRRLVLLNIVLDEELARVQAARLRLAAQNAASEVVLQNLRRENEARQQNANNEE